MADLPRRLLITDLDNTLWDWFEARYESFSALLDGLVALSGVDRAVLEEQIRTVHQLRGTTEYSNLIRETSPRGRRRAPRPLRGVRRSTPRAELHAQGHHLSLPGVGQSLRALKHAGVRIVAYTESGAYWTEWRIRHTGLDGVIDVLYSSPDHDLAVGIQMADLRTGHYDESTYGLRATKHLHVPQGVLKPNGELLSSILGEERCEPADAVYLGDSLMKDIAMAQSVGVLDIHAQYGLVQNRASYDLLRRVTHWSDQDVAREKELARPHGSIVPTLVCHERLSEVLPVFGLSLGAPGTRGDRAKPVSTWLPLPPRCPLPTAGQRYVPE